MSYRTALLPGFARRWLKPAVARSETLAQRLWISGFYIAGRFGGTKPSIAEPSGGRILAVAPHPDDELAGCGGTLVRHLAAGAGVTVAIVTDGRKSAALGLQPDEMAAERKLEARDAAAVLGLSDVRWLGFHEGDWAEDEFREQMAALLREVQPDIIYAPSCIDFHPEHRKVASGLAQAVKREHIVRLFQSQVPLTGALTNVVIDVSDRMPILQSAVAAYRTQFGSLSGFARTRRYTGAYYRAGRHAEPFLELNGDAYAAVHRSPPGADEFRGFRSRPFSDPLAYLVGRSRRRDIKQLIGS